MWSVEILIILFLPEYNTEYYNFTSTFTPAVTINIILLT